MADDVKIERAASKHVNQFPFRRPSDSVVAAVACIAAVVFYQLLFSIGYYPITEGWFSEYAHLIRQGLVPYRDFSLLLPPLYPIQLAAFQSVFGESFFALRLLGVVVVCSISASLFAILRNFFGPWACAISAAVATIFYESGVAFLGYDFTQFLTLYLLLATVALLRSLEKRGRTAFLLTSVGGAFFSLALLTKQSNGGVTSAVLATAFACLVFLTFDWRAALARTFALLVGGAIPLAVTLLWLATKGALPQFFQDVVFMAAAAKGGVAIFQWAHYFFGDPAFWSLVRNALLQLIIVIGAMIALACTIEALLAFETGFSGVEWRRLCQRILFSGRTHAGLTGAILGAMGLIALCFIIAMSAHNACTFCSFLALFGKAVYESSYIWSVDFYIIAFVASVALFMWKRDFGTSKFALLAAFGVGLTIGNGTSSGLSEISTFLGIAVLFAFLIDNWMRYALPPVVPVVIALAFASFLVQKKFASPYAWWQVSTAPVRYADCADVRGIFSGLCMPPEQYQAIQTLIRDIRSASTPREPIYVYPHMPVFYLAAERAPYDNAVVTWFDFTSDSLTRDLSNRLLSCPPAVFVVAEIPDMVVTSHEHLFRGDKPLLQRGIVKDIDVLKSTRDIFLVRRISDINGLAVDVYKRRPGRPLLDCPSR